MIKLTNDDIQKNHVNSISQFKVLKYLKDNLDINVFELYLIDNGIKVVDKDEESLFFYYDDITKNIVIEENKSFDLER